MNFSFYRALITLSILGVSNSYSSGAGHCRSGTAIENRGPHGRPGSGSLSAGRYRLSIDGDPLDPGTAITLATGKEHTITLGNTANGKFRGFLFRLSDKAGGNVKSSIQVSPDFSTLGQSSFRCANDVGGITHVNGNDKTAVAVVVTSNDPIDMFLEVTVVKSTQSSGLWHFDSYDISFEAESTDEPTSSPSKKSSNFPSISPSIIASQFPSFLPSLKPSIAESNSPSLAPSDSPSITTSSTPTLTSSKSPSIQPSVASSNSPTEAASEVPSASPSIPGASGSPSTSPSSSPSVTASEQPSFSPSYEPSDSKSNSPSVTGSSPPTSNDSEHPSAMPILESTRNPTLAPLDSSNDGATSSTSNIPIIHWIFPILCTAIMAFNA
eukprot:scaffold6294_cov268-Chaetoceros_neogracile.AAC.10